MTPSKHTVWPWFAVVLALSLAGCSFGPNRVPVSGQVLIDGEPLTTGTVMVAPSGDRAAFGEIDANGRFVLTTEEEGDGCVTGTHRVTVTATEILNANETRLLVPGIYSDLAASDLTVTIEGPTEDLLIELTWDKGEPKSIRTNSAGDVDPSAM